MGVLVGSRMGEFGDAEGLWRGLREMAGASRAERLLVEAYAELRPFLERPLLMGVEHGGTLRVRRSVALKVAYGLWWDPEQVRAGLAALPGRRFGRAVLPGGALKRKHGKDTGQDTAGAGPSQLGEPLSPDDGFTDYAAPSSTGPSQINPVVAAQALHAWYTANPDHAGELPPQAEVVRPADADHDRIAGRWYHNVSRRVTAVTWETLEALHQAGMPDTSRIPNQDKEVRREHEYRLVPSEEFVGALIESFRHLPDNAGVEDLPADAAFHDAHNHPTKLAPCLEGLRAGRIVPSVVQYRRLEKAGLAQRLDLPAPPGRNQINPVVAARALRAWYASGSGRAGKLPPVEAVVRPADADHDLITGDWYYRVSRGATAVTWETLEALHQAGMPDTSRIPGQDEVRRKHYKVVASEEFVTALIDRFRHLPDNAGVEDLPVDAAFHDAHNHSTKFAPCLEELRAGRIVPSVVQYRRLKEAGLAQRLDLPEPEGKSQINPVVAVGALRAWYAAGSGRAGKLPPGPAVVRPGDADHDLITGDWYYTVSKGKTAVTRETVEALHQAGMPGTSLTKGEGKGRRGHAYKFVPSREALLALADYLAAPRVGGGDAVAGSVAPLPGPGEGGFFTDAHNQKFPLGGYFDNHRKDQPPRPQDILKLLDLGEPGMAVVRALDIQLTQAQQRHATKTAKAKAGTGKAEAKTGKAGTGKAKAKAKTGKAGTAGKAKAGKAKAGTAGKAGAGAARRAAVTDVGAGAVVVAGAGAEGRAAKRRRTAPTRAAAGAGGGPLPGWSRYLNKQQIAYLSQHGLTPYSPPGDGDCFYHALLSLTPETFTAVDPSLTSPQALRAHMAEVLRAELRNPPGDRPLWDALEDPVIPLHQQFVGIADLDPQETARRRAQVIAEISTAGSWNNDTAGATPYLFRLHFNLDLHILHSNGTTAPLLDDPDGRFPPPTGPTHTLVLSQNHWLALTPNPTTTASGPNTTTANPDTNHTTGTSHTTGTNQTPTTDPPTPPTPAAAPRTEGTQPGTTDDHDTAHPPHTTDAMDTTDADDPTHPQNIDALLRLLETLPALDTPEQTAPDNPPDPLIGTFHPLGMLGTSEPQTAPDNPPDPLIGTLDQLGTLGTFDPSDPLGMSNMFGRSWALPASDDTHNPLDPFDPLGAFGASARARADGNWSGFERWLDHPADITDTALTGHDDDLAPAPAPMDIDPTSSPGPGPDHHPAPHTTLLSQTGRNAYNILSGQPPAHNNPHHPPRNTQPPPPPTHDHNNGHDGPHRPDKPAQSVRHDPHGTDEHRSDHRHGPAPSTKVDTVTGLSPDQGRAPDERRDRLGRGGPAE
ncbi:hypothetical protein BX266_5490 [Streptomyces sp. TLI_171]|nr:hypothetical protein BX266_5490 [Streptomyces sp. TLI_171]